MASATRPTGPADPVGPARAGLEHWRGGEWLLLAGGGVLASTLALEWFTASWDSDDPAFSGDPAPAVTAAPVDGVQETEGGSFLVVPDVGWGPLGHPWLEVVGLAIAAIVVVLALQLRPGTSRLAARARLAAAPVVAAAFVLTVVRTLVAPPEDDLGLEPRVLGGAVDAPGIALDPSVGTWVALAGYLVVLAGLRAAIAADRAATGSAPGLRGR